MASLCVADLTHARRDRWAARRFRHQVAVACLDVDRLREVRAWLFSYNRANLFALHDRDYAVGRERGLAAGARALLAARGLPAPARLELITHLRVAGSVFNPVSFFLGYDAGGALETAILEVNNTYGGRHCYVLGPPHRLGDGFVAERRLPVSPFLPGEARYEIRFPGMCDGATRVDVRMDLRPAGGDRPFVARLRGDRVPLDDRALLRTAVLQAPGRVLGLIHWQAMKLHWARVPYRRPT